ncbi:MAG: CopD family protein [Rhodospirillaceae bacterium]
MSRRARALLLLLLLPLLLSAAPALAHAVLIATVPEDSVRLEAPPAEVRLRFNEPVQAVALRLVDGNGRTAAASLEARADTLILTPGTALATGPWLIDYRVMSADGHPVAGTIGFGVAAAPPTDARPPDPDAALLATLGILARALHYGGLLIAAGGGLFLVLVARPDTRPPAGVATLIKLAALLALTGAVAALGLGAASAAGLPLAALGDDITVWRAGLGGRLGTATAVGAAGLTILVAGLAAGTGTGARRAITLGALAATLSLTLTGHAAGAPPRLLAMPVVALHGLAAAFWIGSLWPLAVTLRRQPAAEAAIVVRRFSRLALLAMLLLVLAGAALSLLQAQGSPDPLATDYGRLWLLKLGAVALLLGLAALNKLRLTPALARQDTGAPRALRRSIAAEAALAALVVALTAGLGATPPPRALALIPTREAVAEPAAAGAAPGYVVMAGTALGTAVIDLAPARVGLNRLTIRLSGAPETARLRLLPPAPGAPAIVHELASASPGQYRLDGLDLAMPGRWTIVIETPALVVRTAVPVGGASPAAAPVPH